jgi:hypothetical protein
MTIEGKAITWCDACSHLGKHKPATQVYEMASARGRVAVCEQHADKMRTWAGTLTPVPV